jgi:molybdenum cofactor synthesis domain-containing protein
LYQTVIKKKCLFTFNQRMVESGFMVQSVDVICVGNELLIGKTLNTNAQWLGKRATAVGMAVKRVTVVADEVHEIASAVREALRRKPRFIVTTGGLGPTFDDKTLEGIAAALRCKLEVNAEALRMVKEKYEAYAREKGTAGVELTQPRIKMATIPEKTVPVHNPVGTAPAVQADLNGTVLFALPGVPAEMAAIFEEAVVPLLVQASGGGVFREMSLYAEGIMESALAPFIDKVMRDNAGVYVKSHPKGEEDKPRMEIQFSVRDAEAGKPEERLEKAVAQLAGLIEESSGKVVGSA